MEKENISVIVPCYNEEKRIQKNLMRIYNYLKENFETFELIAVNDGSTDNTLKELKKVQGELHLRIIDNEVNRGKGKVVKQGILESFCDLVMFLDADLGIPVEELEKFIAEFDNGYDIVIASRFVPGLRIVRPVLWHRRIMEKVFRLLRIAIINDWNVKDTQCGFKMFRKKAAMDIFSKATIERFAFDAEVIFLANKLRYKIKELPISLQNPPDSHIRMIRDPLNMIWDLIRIRINDLRGRYKEK